MTQLTKDERTLLYADVLGFGDEDLQPMNRADLDNLTTAVENAVGAKPGPEPKTPRLAIMAVAQQVCNALEADRKSEGYDLEAGMFGPAFSNLLRKWAALEYAAQPALSGCACRWDADDKRVATCVRHQGWLDVVQEWADRAKVAEAKLAQSPAPGEAAREYMTGYSDAKEWAKPSQALELSDDEIDALLPTITLKGLGQKQQIWLTKKDAIAFARTIIAAIKQGGQHD